MIQTMTILALASSKKYPKVFSRPDYIIRDHNLNIIIYAYAATLKRVNISKKLKNVYCI